MGRNKFHGAMLAQVADMAKSVNTSINLNVTVKVEKTVNNPMQTPKKHRQRIHKGSILAASCDNDADYCYYGNSIGTKIETTISVTVFGKEIKLTRAEYEQRFGKK